MSIFQRLGNILRAKTNQAIDQIEDPIPMIEQGLRDLKRDLAEAMQGLAQLKAQEIRARKEGTEQGRMAQDYERKAMLLLQRAEAGELDMTEAERLATEAVGLRDRAAQQSATILHQADQQKAMVEQLQGRVDQLKSTIAQNEVELRTLRARSQTADASAKINKQLSGVDSTGTIAMLERMKERVAEKEALATAYGQLAESAGGVDAQIDKALGAGKPQSAALLELRAKMDAARQVGSGQPQRQLPSQSTVETV
jgi:phage shock protein A